MVDSKKLGAKMKHTPVICGAIYEKDMRGATYHVLCISTKVDPAGNVQGVFCIFGLANERLTEGSEPMDEYVLISSPVFEKKRKRKAS